MARQLWCLAQGRQAVAGTCCLCSGHHPVSADSPDSRGSASLKNTPPPSEESCSGCSGIMNTELLRLLRQLTQEPKGTSAKGRGTPLSFSEGMGAGHLAEAPG